MFVKNILKYLLNELCERVLFIQATFSQRTDIIKVLVVKGMKT